VPQSLFFSYKSPNFRLKISTPSRHTTATPVKLNASPAPPLTCQNAVFDLTYSLRSVPTLALRHAKV
jgi:hypothetical protein